MPAPFLPRNELPHDIPHWVQPGARHYISFNVSNRTDKPLLAPSIANALLQGFADYERMNHWYVWLAVVMPDHIHMILTFDLQRQEVKKNVLSWRSYHARTLGINWQKDFFEHRLRNDDEFVEKCHYIRMNPVRAGLCVRPEEWSYIIDRTKIDGGQL